MSLTVVLLHSKGAIGEELGESWGDHHHLKVGSGDPGGLCGGGDILHCCLEM